MPLWLFFHDSAPRNRRCSWAMARSACKKGVAYATPFRVGERGFEPPTSASRTLRANRAAPLPATDERIARGAPSAQPASHDPSRRRSVLRRASGPIIRSEYAPNVRTTEAVHNNVSLSVTRTAICPPRINFVARNNAASGLQQHPWLACPRSGCGRISTVLDARVAQWIERLPPEQEATGSSPVGRTTLSVIIRGFA